MFLLAAALTGCAGIPEGDLQRHVTETLRQRGQHELGWNAEAPEERIVQERIGQLLAGELTAERAVIVALLNNRELRAIMARAEVARADVVQAGLLDNPAFGLKLRYGGGTAQEYSLFAELLNLFTLSARKTLAGRDLERARLEVAQRAIELIAEVKHCYFNVLADRQMLELTRQVFDAAQAASDLASRQYAAGNLSQREQALQQSFFAQAALDEARAAAQFTTDREKLNRLMGAWGSQTGWTLPPRLPEVPATLPSLAQAEMQALRQRLDLAAQREAVEAAHLALGYAARSRWLSLFGVGVTVERDTDGGHSVGPDLEFTVPLFDRGQARMLRLEAQLTEAQSRYAQRAIEVRSDVRESTARLEAAHAALTHYREAILPLAQRVLDETLKFYNGMLVGVYELLDAKHAQIAAARDYVGAWRDFWIAWSDMERAQGGALPTEPRQPPSTSGSAASGQGG
jgi:cobalt-zinc-cadmium efflux system outer membrane protein